MTNANPPVVILCGGKGLRLSGHGGEIPKALVEVGGRPILWHVMKIYSHYGYDRFILCLGHLGSKIKEFFLEGHHWRMGDVTLNIKGGDRDEIVVHSAEKGWKITFAETGEETNTGGRLKRIARYIDSDTFFATYVDGVSDVNIASLLEAHRRHGRMATLTSVNPSSQFGMLDVDGDGKVRRFLEKPRLDTWINGGFFVLNRSVLDQIGENSDLERDTLVQLAGQGELVAHPHQGFWACMDTYKDTLTLSQLWSAGQAPWRVWDANR